MDATTVVRRSRRQYHAPVFFSSRAPHARDQQDGFVSSGASTVRAGALAPNVSSSFASGGSMGVSIAPGPGDGAVAGPGLRGGAAQAMGATLFA